MRSEADMSDIILMTKNLTKKYNHTLALDNINLTIERGKIYGFIGQNGAGKTTLIRLIVGLSFPTGGELHLFGKTGKQALQEQRKRIGCMVETPALYPNMTAVQNLEVQRLQRGYPIRRSLGKRLSWWVWEIILLEGRQYVTFRSECVSG